MNLMKTEGKIQNEAGKNLFSVEADPNQRAYS